MTRASIRTSRPAALVSDALDHAGRGVDRRHPQTLLAHGKCCSATARADIEHGLAGS